MALPLLLGQGLEGDVGDAALGLVAALLHRVRIEGLRVDLLLLVCDRGSCK